MSASHLDITDGHEGTDVPSTEGAVVTNNDMTNIEILIPETEELGDAMLFLIACALRFTEDKDFVQSQIAWFYSHTNERLH